MKTLPHPLNSCNTTKKFPVPRPKWRKYDNPDTPTKIIKMGDESKGVRIRFIIYVVTKCGKNERRTGYTPELVGEGQVEEERGGIP